MRRLIFFAALFVLLFGCGDTIGEGACIGILNQGDATSGCITTATRCDDDHNYELSCDLDGHCTCSVDSKKGTPSKATQCPANIAGLNTACGWMLTND